MKFLNHVAAISLFMAFGGLTSVATATEADPTPTPAPIVDKAQKVSASISMSKNLVNVRAQTSAKKVTNFTLQRLNGKKWVNVKKVRSDSKGAYVFKKAPFSKLRIQASEVKGFKKATSNTVNASSKWNAGYSSLKIKGASVSITPLGGKTYTIGDHRNDIALSTLKVPIVVAADAHKSGRSSDKSAAIKVSDNNAAQRVYVSMGGDRRSDLYRHLAKYGDKSTSIHPTNWGYTKWHVSNQSKYASKLGCAKIAQPTLKLMRNVTPAHQFGMDQTRLKKQTAQKVGFGGTIVRQLAVVKTSDGRVYGVSILANGGFSSGKSKVNKIANWTANRLEALPAQKC